VCVGKLLSRLPLCEVLLIVIVATAGFALWTLTFFHRKNTGRFIRVNRFATETATDHIELWKATDKLMTCQLHGRIGNMMFAYASLVGIALKSHRTPVLPMSHFLRSMFHIKAAVLPHRLAGVAKLSELWAGTYDDRLERFQSDKHLLELTGYFQSWKYFADIEHKIRAEFTFHDRLTVAVDEFLQSTISTYYGPGVQRRDVVLIGVHVRVTDMAADANVARGYSIATPEYFTAAMEFYQSRFPHERLLYILATDDEEWCRHSYPYSSSGKSPVVHTTLGPAVQDLAILAACNHTVISVGSFGWWAAWLGNGMTVYYKNFVRFNSSLAHEYVLNDYYPDSWVAM